jgi:hypothetical protein
LNEQVVGFLVAVRTGVAVAGDVADDQRRIGLAQPLRSKREAGRRARRQVLDEHVGARQQRGEDPFCVRLLEVEGQRFLRSVQPHEVARHAVDRRIVCTREIAGAWPLNLDHPRAEVSQMAGGERRRNGLLQRHDGQSFKRPHQYDRGSPSTCSAM